MIDYPDVRCVTCGANPLAPCIENGEEVPCHGSRRMVAMWRAALPLAMAVTAFAPPPPDVTPAGESEAAPTFVFPLSKNSGQA